MKTLNTLETKTVTINNNSFTVELKKVVKTEIVRSSDKRAGTYVDNNSISTVAFVNGKGFMTCNDMDCVIEELSYNYKKFIA